MYMHVGSNPIILSKILFKNGRWMTHKCFLEFAVILNGFGGKQFRNCMCCLCKRVPVLVSCLLWLLCSCSLFVLLTLQLCSFVPPFRSGLCGPESFLALLPWFIVDFAALSFIFYGQFCGSLFVCFFEIALKFHWVNGRDFEIDMGSKVEIANSEISEMSARWLPDSPDK